MGRIIVFFGVVLTAGWMSSCTDANSIGVSLFVWNNQSDHRITLSSDRVYFFQDEVIEPNNTFIYETSSGHSVQTPWSAFGFLKVAFEDGTEVTYSYYNQENDSFPAGYDERYDLTLDENYQFEELNGTERGSTGVRIDGRWTYTFTNADYDAAKAIVDARQTE